MFKNNFLKDIYGWIFIHTKKTLNRIKSFNREILFNLIHLAKKTPDNFIFVYL